MKFSKEVEINDIKAIIETKFDDNGVTVCISSSVYRLSVQAKYERIDEKHVEMTVERMVTKFEEHVYKISPHIKYLLKRDFKQN